MVCKWYRVCPIKWHTDRGALDEYWVQNFCLKKNGYKKCVRYKKESDGEYHPDNMLPDGSIDESL